MEEAYIRRQQEELSQALDINVEPVVSQSLSESTAMSYVPVNLNKMAIVVDADVKNPWLQLVGRIEKTKQRQSRPFPLHQEVKGKRVYEESGLPRPQSTNRTG